MPSVATSNDLPPIPAFALIQAISRSGAPMSGCDRGGGHAIVRGSPAQSGSHPCDPARSPEPL